jgi:hypothetical protein
VRGFAAHIQGDASMIKYVYKSNDEIKNDIFGPCRSAWHHIFSQQEPRKKMCQSGGTMDCQRESNEAINNEFVVLRKILQNIQGKGIRSASSARQVSRTCKKDSKSHLIMNKIHVSYEHGAESKIRGRICSIAVSLTPSVTRGPFQDAE